MAMTSTMTAYTSAAIRGTRDIEYDVFSQVTRLLLQSSRDCRGNATIWAVSKNNELWTILAADLAAAGNRHDDDVKAGLISLALFSLKHGQGVLSGRETTDALIDVNLAVMKGLRGAVEK